MRRRTLTLGWVGMAMALAGLTHLAIAQAQYGTPYPYSQQRMPQTQLPSSARHVGGLTGNPFQNNRVRPTGLPVGSAHNFFGTGAGNPMAHQPTRKPFSNVTPYSPLITSQEAARLEVARGLWRF